MPSWLLASSSTTSTRFHPMCVQGRSNPIPRSDRRAGMEDVEREPWSTPSATTPWSLFARLQAEFEGQGRCRSRACPTECALISASRSPTATMIERVGECAEQSLLPRDDDRVGSRSVRSQGQLWR